LDLEKFNLAHVLPIVFNYTCNYLKTFNFMQFHICQAQLSAPKLTAIFILPISGVLELQIKRG